MKMERTSFFGQIYHKVNKLDGTNVLDGFNYNTNLDTGIQNINKKIKNTWY